MMILLLTFAAPTIVAIVAVSIASLRVSQKEPKKEFVAIRPPKAINYKDLRHFDELCLLARSNPRSQPFLGSLFLASGTPLAYKGFRNKPVMREA